LIRKVIILEKLATKKRRVMTSYTSDYYTWTKEQVSLLKSRRFEQVDWVNLIEELEELGNSRENALESYLERLLEHLLKSSGFK
jgi:hypothetical protein